MTHKQREWARQFEWFFCSDSQAIWVKVGENVKKFTSYKTLKEWATGRK